MANVIEFFDESGEIIVTRMPPGEAMPRIAMGTQLVVQESQLACFFRDGRALDVFGPGRHTLSTQNLPGVAKVFSQGFGKSPFSAYVYYVATKTFTRLGWGTPTPVMFRDAEFRMVTLRGHGSFSLKVVDAPLFLNTIVGSKGIETTYALEEYFRGIIVSRMNEQVGRTLKSILDLPMHYSDIAYGIKDAVSMEFEQYGIRLVDLVVEAITVPPEVQEQINKATGIAAQDALKYQQIATADAMREAAKNPGMAGQGMGAGMGFGMGMQMAQAFAGAMIPQQQQQQPPQQAQQAQFAGAQPPAMPQQQQPPQHAAAGPAANSAAGSDPDMEQVKAKLRRFKELLDEGLITQDEFATRRQAVLDQLS